MLAAFAAHAGPRDDARARAQALVSRMTVPEKVAQLQNHAPAIPRLGVPAYDWWNEGLHGIARNGYATVFPQAIGLAASWNPALLEQVGETVATEARAKFDATGEHGPFQGLTVWSPNINIFRDPRWGRGQETYGEDPFLTARLAVAYVQGVQGDDPVHPRAIATPKHLAVHSGPERGRHGFDSVVSAHDLEDTYLPAFRAAVMEGHAGSVMCAYNAINGTPACADRWLLDSVLRQAWGFRGYVVSDCDAVDDMTQFHHYRPDDARSSAAAIRAGTDLDCGQAYAALGEAVAKGYARQADLDAALVRLFTARYQLDLADRPTPVADAAIEGPTHHALALEAARESMVLLKNAHGTLPLREGTRIAVIGPDADTLETLEANYHGTARAPITPLQGLRERFGAGRVSYAQGAPVAAGVPVPVPETALRTPGGQRGLQGGYFDAAGLVGSARLTRTDRTIDFDWDRAAPGAGLDPGHYAARWIGTLLPPGPGDYTLAVHVDRCFDCHGHDPVRLYLDGRELIDDAGTDTPTLQAQLHFADRSPHALRLELVHSGEDQGIRLQWLAPARAQLDEALAAARDADVVVAFVGLSPDVEGEELRIEAAGFDGGDRTDIALPGAQRNLLEHVAASGKPLVIVLMSGSAVALDRAQEHAGAILAAWYPGQAGGTAIARVLAGDDDPGGRLPVTFYRATSDLPPFTRYDMRGRTYRYFNGTPLYPFGHGLSYTRFAYEGLALSTDTLAAGNPLRIGVTVRNTGPRAGDEVAQAYLHATDVPLAPRRTLVAFRRVHLKPGESQRVTFELSPRQLSTVDAAGRRSVVAGSYRLSVGGGQPGDGPGEQATFTITGRHALPR
ncbi:MAG TPA: glycoside hydrolase family 3 C-terminal domain-containing protein [Frateuria sp.]|uniref:glycoside hydrolase family 3 C-terminal domain-containing protein n=1 Tax=Frateuria sp. TaxID=2211372 RepID=UPI002DE85331|nr:glycoside hydrolase family 3 C-terminal domain-containing protein [Frateuria sp.]